MAKPRTTAFTRGGYLFRPARFWPDSPHHFAVRRRGDHNSHSLAIIYPASDGLCWSVSVAGQAYDARPSFEAACDLVMARLPIE